MRLLCLHLMMLRSSASQLRDCTGHGLPASFSSCALEGVPELCCDGRYEASLGSMCHHPSLFPPGTCQNISDSMRNPLFADVPLTSWPMLMTHDAATGYLQHMLDPTVAWSQTQSASARAFTAQLDCGARAFDMRPHVNQKGELVFHHGDIEIRQDAEAALLEILEWAEQHPTLEDLVLIYMWDCTGTNCNSKMEDLLRKHSLSPVANCSYLKRTLGEAASTSKLARGGHVLVVTDCVSQQYNASLACSGFDKSLASEMFPETWPSECLNLDSATVDEQVVCGKRLQQLQLQDNASLGYYHCWIGDSGRDFALLRLLNFLMQVSASPLAPDRFTELQALWQETPQSVVNHDSTAKAFLYQVHAHALLWRTSLFQSHQSKDRCSPFQFSPGGLHVNDPVSGRSGIEPVHR